MMRTVRFVIVVQPSKAIKNEALKTANLYTRKCYGKISKHIRYTSNGEIMFAPPHVTVRGGSNVKAKAVQEFVGKVKKIARKYKKFRLTFNGTRSFSKNKRPFVYYWRVKPNKTLNSLEKSLYSELKNWSSYRFPSYTPHLTIVYDDRSRNPLLSHAPGFLPKRQCIISALTILKKNAWRSRIKYYKEYLRIPLG